MEIFLFQVWLHADVIEKKVYSPSMQDNFKK